VADLAGALDAALRDRYRIAEVKTPVTQRRGLLARMSQLEKLHARKGDKPGAAVARAAQSAGIPVRTWRDWRKGTHPPSARSQRRLERAYVEQITLPRYRKAAKEKKAPARVNVSAEIWWTDSDKKDNGDYRPVKLYGMRGVMGAVIRAWIAAGPEAAADTFERGVAQVHGVPRNEDGTPGVQFKGNQVEVTFP
jgi:hypothetical protein